ncbi:MAG: type II toxin-antitoxin system VapC family toxin [Spirochaetales bacterium]|nr:type II toxin-antitoxin system VapC family toxin [Spirochaetales bacterium]MBQ7282159.1 type II toxin-antitoxin system VapC family toxin [Spirochaetales bacterium]MBR0521501.1 type II toxin-antitoxin system VapC family toxin [Spirochaetales bacterium]
MLDTNIIIYAKNRKSDSVLKRLMSHMPSDLCISAITLAELEYGIANSSKPDQNRLALSLFLSGIEIMPFSADAAKEYGEIRKQLSDSGKLIGANDLLIAAHAKSLGLTLVTNNTDEFKRIKDLNIENWC